MKNLEYEDDIVFAGFIRYMEKALAHRRINYLKHQEILKKTEFSITDYQFDIYDNAMNENEKIIEVETNKVKFYEIKKCMKLLTYKQKKVLELNYTKNMMLKDIAKEMNISIKATEKLKSRAIQKLKEILKNLNKEEL